MLKNRLVNSTSVILITVTILNVEISCASLTIIHLLHNFYQCL